MFPSPLKFPFMCSLYTGTGNVDISISNETTVDILEEFREGHCMHLQTYTYSVDTTSLSRISCGQIWKTCEVKLASRKRSLHVFDFLDIVDMVGTLLDYSTKVRYIDCQT